MLNSVQAQDPHNKQLLSPDSQLPRSSQCTNAESRVKEKKTFCCLKQNHNRAREFLKENPISDTSV
jgi:hypothetical protein